MTNAILRGKTYVTSSQYYGGPERFDKLEISSGNPGFKYLVCKKMIMLLVAAMPAFLGAGSGMTYEEDGIRYEVHDYLTVYDFGEHNYSYPVSAIVKSGVGPVARIAAYLGVSEITASSIPVVKIEDDAFRGCEALTRVTIPSTVVIIGSSAFSGCSGLMSFSVDEDNPVYKSVSGLLLTKDGKKFLAVPQGLTSVTIPSGVTTIERYAFYGCRRLTSVTIGKDVTSFWPSEFKSCSGLMSFSVATANPSCKSVSGLLLTKDGTRIIAIPMGLTSVTFPNSVTEIQEGLLSGWSGSVTMGNGITNIGNETFSGCNGLTSVTIPNSVTNIGHEAFYKCSGLTSVTIPNSVTSIGQDAFFGCSGLTSVTIGNSVTNIGSLAFCCSGLRDVTVPQYVLGRGIRNVFPADCSLITNVAYSSTITIIDSYAFSGCSGLTSVTIPDGVTSIGDYAFSGCSGLTSVTIPDSVTSIGNSAFSGCSGLMSFSVSANNPVYKSVSGMLLTKDGTRIIAVPGGLTNVAFPNSVTSIGERAFSGCSGLTSVTIPDGVTSIGDYAFSGCSGLTSVSIPDSVTSIGSSAFSGCSGLMSFSVAANNPFYKSDSGLLLTKDGTRIIAAPWGLTSVVVPNSVTSIGNYAFSGCSNLTSVTIGNGVTSIGNYAFYNCGKLTKVTIPDSVISIDDSAFSGCGGIDCVTLPGNRLSSGALGTLSLNGWTLMSRDSDGEETYKSKTLGTGQYDSQYTSMSLTLVGPYVLSFSWKVSCGTRDSLDWRRSDWLRRRSKITTTLNAIPDSCPCYNMTHGQHVRRDLRNQQNRHRKFLSGT
ncbi:MAG: leucine-rich repeat domain-containing protein, partial [Kiritimatiellia bacterium]|nr:leucine-rich repeat domain-containing protein [Kiritimatiellia bacterium]